MTGIIVALASNTRTGTIRLADGSYRVFSATGLVGDFESLALGDRVSFEAAKDKSSHVAVRVSREPFSLGPPRGKDGGPPDLRYAGFDQSDNIRCYRFYAISSGRSVQHCVTVDLSLLSKYQIGIQEAPALCLQKLTADLQDARNTGPHQLGDSELEEFAASRAALLQRKKSKQSARRASAPPAPSKEREAR